MVFSLEPYLSMCEASGVSSLELCLFMEATGVSSLDGFRWYKRLGCPRMYFSNTLKAVFKIYLKYVKNCVWFGTGSMGPPPPPFLFYFCTLHVLNFRERKFDKNLSVFRCHVKSTNRDSNKVMVHIKPLSTAYNFEEN